MHLYYDVQDTEISMVGDLWPKWENLYDWNITTFMFIHNEHAF